jgi:PadR family transcriptional regulator PadR
LSVKPRNHLEGPQGVLPRNFLRPCLLLLLKEGQAHGYDLLVRLADFGLRVDPGGLYRILRALEKEGLVTSWWETSGAGPPRRTYQPTEEGENWLMLWGGTLRESRRTLDRFLGRYESVVDEGPAGSSEDHGANLTGRSAE